MESLFIKIGIRGAIAWQHMSSCLALKIGYINKTHTHTQSGAENSLFQFWLTVTKAFSPFYLEETTNYWSLSAWCAYGFVNSHAVSQLIMRVHKPEVEYRLVHLYG